MIDGEAMWSSDKLGRCALWARREYPWLYPLADANGCFELTNLGVVHGLVAPNRGDLTCATLKRVFEEYTRNGLLFTWEDNGKTYGYWTKSEGRLPPPSQRKRHKQLAPTPPGQELAQYLKSFYIKAEGDKPPEINGDKKSFDINEVNNNVDLGQARVRGLVSDRDRGKPRGGEIVRGNVENHRKPPGENRSRDFQPVSEQVQGQKLANRDRRVMQEIGILQDNLVCMGPGLEPEIQHTVNRIANKMAALQPLSQREYERRREEQKARLKLHLQKIGVDVGG